MAIHKPTPDGLEYMLRRQSEIMVMLVGAMQDILLAASRETKSEADAKLRLITIATYARTALQGDCS